MNSTVLSSRQNPTVQQLRKKRDDPKSPWIFLEGPKLLEEALKSGVVIEQLAVVPALLETAAVRAALSHAKEVIPMTAYVLKTLSDVEAPQGVIAVCRKPDWTWESLLSKSPLPLLILDGLQDPGNAAAILRTAEAAGAAGVITTVGTVRLYSPKALRGAAGATLRLPVLEHLTPLLIGQKLAQAGYSLLGTASQGGTSYSKVDWQKPWALVLGQEGGGISSVWQGQTVSIPMKLPVESLNVASAAAILLYESNRWRNVIPMS